MKKNTFNGMSIGIPSIMIIMVTLCLLCFAGLSIVSANADLSLSKKLAQRTTDYYHACNEAQKDLSYALKKEPFEDSFSNIYIINDNQQLSVEAVLSASSEKPITITLWKIETIENPELDTSLSVLLGNQ